ncbi:coactosin-like protein [Branchiostoma floridae x Branchiostoma belcheri]
MPATVMDKDSLREAYQDVRDDSSDTIWATFGYQENNLVHLSSGAEFDGFREQFNDDGRIFGFLRVTAGDELSKRSKFILITWVGENVSPLKRAKTGTDKALVKQVIQSIATEIMTSDLADIDLDFIMGEVKKAGGANYGTGVRD